MKMVIPDRIGLPIDSISTKRWALQRNDRKQEVRD